MSASIASGFGPAGSGDLSGGLAPAGARSEMDSRRSSDRLFVKAIVAVTFPIFLAAALVRRIGPRIGGAPDRSKGRSILREATAAARTCGSLALMG